MRGLLIGFLFAVIGSAAPQMTEQPPVSQTPMPNTGLPGQGDPRQSGPGSTGSSGSSGSSKKEKNQKEDNYDKVKAAGKVLRNDGKLLEIEGDDTRIIVCKITAKTEFTGPDGKIKGEDIEPGTHVRLTAIGDDEHALTATSVVVENFTEKPKNEVTATVDRAPDDDEDRPIVKRGIPKKKLHIDDDQIDRDADKATVASSSRPRPDADVAPGTPAKPKKLIDRAIEAGHEFTDRLPNFVCQQITTRYERSNKVDGFRPIDVISANITYTDGVEKYENIKVGNRAVNEGMMDIKNGARSTGEFGTVLDSLFAREAGAEFTFSRNELFRRVTTQVFDFKVSHENSNWTISTGGETIHPGYSGSIWVDKDTARVLRFERSADDIPEAFPQDTVEQTIDYEPVLIGSRKVLLPVQSKNLACQRGSSYCTRNIIEWRNYKQFGAESSIDFEKK